MKVRDLAQMVAIAHVGAAKMAGQDYRAEYHDPDSYIVSRPGENGERVEYRVFWTNPVFCECPFFTENHERFGVDTVCKHVVFAIEQAWADEWADANCPPADAITTGDSHQMPGLSE